MRTHTLIFAILWSFFPAFSQERKSDLPLPADLVIGRRTFFDFGPPFNYYELILLHSEATGASIERITLTPPGIACVDPAKIEVARAIVKESVAQLLGQTNPCAIPENKLRQELKRRRKGLVFSGADIDIGVPCQGKERIIEADILDRDMFAAAANTPEYTSWTMQLLEKIDKATGPGVMEKPIFGGLGEEDTALLMPSNTLEGLASGKFDSLFRNAPDLPSDLYKQAMNPPPPATSELVNSTPLKPDVIVEPKYPPIAKLARIEGQVAFRFKIDAAGKAAGLSFDNGPLMLQNTTAEAVGAWRFKNAQAGQEIQATVTFKLNCTVRP
jgi:TonB family protein